MRWAHSVGALSLSRRHGALMAALVACGFALYASLALLVPVPRVFPDELRYLDAASSLIHGHGLSVRGGSYGFGGLYPTVVLAPILWAVHDRDTAYELIKVVNAFVFALAAVPVYLLAR